MYGRVSCKCSVLGVREKEERRRSGVSRVCPKCEKQRNAVLGETK